MGEGWISISRGIREHWIWQDSDRLKWWLDLLLLASWKDEKVLLGGRLRVIKRGQAVISVRSLRNRWAKRDKDGRVIERPGLNRVMGFLQMLEEDGMIVRDLSEHQNTILTICNYERYQSGGNTCGNTLGNTIYNNKYTTSPPPNARAREEDEIGRLRRDLDEAAKSEVWKESLARNYRLSPEDIRARFPDFIAECVANDKLRHTDMRDLKQHFNSWLRIDLRQKQREKEYSNGRTNENRRDGRAAKAERDEEFRRHIIAKLAGAGSEDAGEVGY